MNFLQTFEITLFVICFYYVVYTVSEPICESFAVWLIVIVWTIAGWTHDPEDLRRKLKEEYSRKRKELRKKWWYIF